MQCEYLGPNLDDLELKRRCERIIYRCRQIVPSLPRIRLYIAKSRGDVLGVGRVGEYVVWISEEMRGQSDASLRQLIVHELGHAVFGLEHDKRCPVMLMGS